MGTTARFEVSPQAAEWATVYGKVVLTVGRCTDGYITCQGEFDDDVFRFEGDEAGTLTSTALDAWQRRESAS